MLSMEKVAEVHRLKYDQGRTYLEIQGLLGMSSKTVSKALNHPKEFVEGYQRKTPSPRPVLEKYVKRIEDLLAGKTWAQEKGRVVRRTARWVYRKLKKEGGYKGSECTVRAYVRERFRQPRPACPIEHPPAAEVQYDFGEYAVKIGDVVRAVHFVGAIFPHSTRRFLFAYPAERQECLFDAMERTFQKAGGVTQRATLDNTTLAVKKVLEGRRREETEAYARFRTLLGVEPRYTNRAAGWEKGHVEGTVGWAKRQILLDLEVKDWEALQQILEEECAADARERRHRESGKLVEELFEEERQLLCPVPYEGRRSYRTVRATVSPGGLVQVDCSRYSVPIRLRGRHLRVHLYCDELVVTFKHEEVARHARDWNHGGEHYKVEHYLELLRRAPALLDHGKPFTRMPQWLLEMREALEDDKSLVELLLAVDSGKYTLEELEKAARSAMEGRRSVTRARIEQEALVGRNDAGEVEALREQECGKLGQHHFAIEAPEMYDEIMMIGGGRRLEAVDSCRTRLEKEVG